MENVDLKPDLFPSSQDTAAWFAGVLEVGSISGISVTEYRDSSSGVLRRCQVPILGRHHSVTNLA